MENQKHIEAYQDLFDYLHNEHDLILLQSEMDPIINLSLKAVEKYNNASGWQKPKTSNEKERLIHFRTEVMKDKDSINNNK